MSDTIEISREELADGIERLRRDRAQATLKKRAFKDEELLRQKQLMLEALDIAEAEAVRQERERFGKDAEAARKQHLKDWDRLKSEALETWARCNDHTLGLRRGYQQLRDLYVSMVRTSAALGAMTAPLQHTSLANDFGNLFISEMRPASGGLSQIGPLVFRETVRPKAGTNWLDFMSARLASHTAKLKGESLDDNESK